MFAALTGVMSAEAVKLGRGVYDFATRVVQSFPAASYDQDQHTSLLEQARADARRQREQIKALASKLK